MDFKEEIKYNEALNRVQKDKRVLYSLNYFRIYEYFFYRC